MTQHKQCARRMVSLGLAIGMVWAAHGQDTPVFVRTLTLTAKDQPKADLPGIAASLQGLSYTTDELEERVREKMRDNGYYFAQPQTPQFTNEHDDAGKRSVDASVAIEAGEQYNTGEITFKHTAQFKTEQLRSQFALVPGSVFNASAVSAGIEKLKHFYEAQGYADVGAVPSMAVNEEKHTIDVSVEVEEGFPYLFGQLTLDGAEPVAGESKALQTAWKEVEGKRYNPDVLKKWLAANGPKSAKGAPALHPRAEGIADTEAHLMNVRLIYQ